MLSDRPQLSRLAAVGTVLSLLTCYGTLALIGVLGMLGIVISFNNTVWAGAIVAFAVLAVIGLGLSLTQHHKPWPVLLGTLGAAVLVYVMFVQYDRMIEILGFIFLSAAAFWDWRLKSKLIKAATK